MNDSASKFERAYERVFREQYASPFVMYFFFGISMLGAALFTVTLFAGVFHIGAGEDGLRSVQDSTLAMCLGMLGFSLFFPMFLVSALTRYFMHRIDRLEAALMKSSDATTQSPNA